MRRHFVTLLIVALSACGGDTTGVQQAPRQVGNVVIDHPPGDTVKPDRAYPRDSLRTTVTDPAGNPVGGVAVNFVTRPDGCARTASGGTVVTTSAQGRAVFHPVSGIEAITSTGTPCWLKAVQSENGQLVAADSVETVIEPGPADTVMLGGVGYGGQASVQAELDAVRDSHGNPARWRLTADSVAHAASDDPLSPDSKTLVVDRDGTASVTVVVEGEQVCMGEITASTDASGNTVSQLYFPLRRKDAEGCTPG